MEHDDQHLREKAKLLLQRERELFDLRLKHEQVAVWLAVGQALPALFLTQGGALEDVWNQVRRTLIIKLRFQRVLALEVRDGLRPLAPPGPERPLSETARAFIERQPSGCCNEPEAAEEIELAQALGLHRFLWSRIARSRDAPILLVAGFDRTKAVFQSPFVNSDVAHFGNAAQQLESLIQNALLIAELEREKAQLHEANVTLERRDGELSAAAERLQAANESLEQRVSERTRELAGKNAQLSLVLDNVDQALVMVDLEGRLTPGRSAAFDRWFGAYAGAPLLTEHIPVDERFESLVSLGLASLRDDILPRSVSIGQMPSHLVVGERQFECRYLPVDEGDQLEALLLVIDDVTEHVVRVQENAVQRELLAAFTALMQDRNGFLGFFAESEQMLERLRHGSDSGVQQRRLLHTLKGNASTFGLHVIAELCHSAESELTNEGIVERETLERLRERWNAVGETLRAVVPRQLHNAVEVSDQELLRLIQRAERCNAPEMVDELRRLRLEPIARALGRLGKHARALAVRMQRGELNVEIDADDLRLDPRRWAPLWSALIHLVRNAIDHGIEPSDERTRLGKSKAGCLRLEAHSTERGYRLEVDDDGRGIDWERVREVSEELKRPARSRSDLVEALLSPGLSTRRDVTRTSGRGVGLAALADVVRQLDGTLTVTSDANRGTRWTLDFPLE